MIAGGLTSTEAAALYDRAASDFAGSAYTTRRQVAIERMMLGKAAFLCKDAYYNNWGINACMFAMEQDLGYCWGKFQNLAQYIMWRHARGRDHNLDLAHHLSRLVPLNPAAERDMAVALTYVASLKQKAPSP